MSLTKTKLLEMGYESGTVLAGEYHLNPRTVSDVLARAKVQRVKLYGVEGRAEMVFYEARAAGIALTEYVEKRQARVTVNNTVNVAPPQPQQKELPLPTDDFKSLTARIAALEKKMDALMEKFPSVNRVAAFNLQIPERLHD
jgi:hypothetical protein